jgi:hypothetical protein
MYARAVALSSVIVLGGLVPVLRAQDALPLRLHDRPLPQVVASWPSVALDAPSQAASRDRRVADRRLGLVAASLYAAMALDTKSTFETKAWCPRCIEADPFAAPFVNAGPAATYSAGLAFDTGVIYLSMRMRRSDHAIWRRTWFVLPVGLAAGHVLAARHNYDLRRSCVTSPGCR